MIKIVAVALFSVVMIAPATAAPARCLRVDEIQSTTSPDGATLVVAMRDGTVWNNHLDGPCPGLKFEGFAWVVHGGRVCEGMQTLRVLHTGQVCRLGKFVRARPAQK
jgi:hypothetical protein